MVVECLNFGPLIYKNFNLFIKTQNFVLHDEKKKQNNVVYFYIFIFIVIYFQTYKTDVTYKFKKKLCKLVIIKISVDWL